MFDGIDQGNKKALSLYSKAKFITLQTTVNTMPCKKLLKISVRKIIIGTNRTVARFGSNSFIVLAKITFTELSNPSNKPNITAMIQTAILIKKIIEQEDIIFANNICVLL